MESPFSFGYPFFLKNKISKPFWNSREFLARLFRFCIALTSVLLLVEFVVIVDPPKLSPAPAPESGAEDVALSPHALSFPLSPTVPSPSPYFGSPPAPPLALEYSPSPSPYSPSTPTPFSFNSGHVG
ncbi:hypothetical protein PVL29_013710 [Vitis rotundifolia]|uniref:Uncharacterized protein n=1 Tax=Vitis rotundifolia TaxID=103349 RepID=A0AA38ZN03_VITRO|nr:hypothetical protein PVL29_013710 [Vitis rotundifolia]